MKLYRIKIEDGISVKFDERIWVDKSKADLECLKKSTVDPDKKYHIIEFDSAD